MQRLALCAILLGLSGTALAIPATFQHQARLFDTAGVPLDGPHDVKFTLYDGATAGTVLWEETDLAVEFDAGYMAVTLGDGTPIDPNVLDTPEVWLGLTIGTDPELAPRLPFNSVPYALRALGAENATNVTGGIVDASEIRVNGTTVINSTGDVTGTVDWSTITNIPTAIANPSDTVGDLNCTADQQAVFDGNVWSCEGDNAHAHAASDVTSGQFAIQQLPVGTSDQDVAVGDHGHSGDAITSGTVAATYLPVGTGAQNVAAGDHNHDSLTLTGTLVIGGDGATCTTAGEIRYNTSLSDLEVCDGTSWGPINAAPGKSAGTAATSCLDLYETGNTGNGVYWIDPDGNGAFQVVCDINAGGWTMLMKANGDCTFPYDDPAWTTANTVNPGALDSDPATAAKFDSFNRLPVTQFIARFEAINYNMTIDLGAAATGLDHFQTTTDLGDPNGFHSSFAVQNGYRDYGTNLTCAARGNVRWGWTFNNELTCDSNDSGAGIGMLCSGGNHDTDMGSWATCCASQPNGNYPEAVVIWGR